MALKASYKADAWAGRHEAAEAHQIRIGTAAFADFDVPVRHGSNPGRSAPHRMIIAATMEAPGCR